MADEKKPEAKPPVVESSMFSHPDPFVEIVWLLLSIFFILYLINGFINLISSGGTISFGSEQINLREYLTLLFWKIFTYIQYTAILLSPLLVIAIVYLYKKLSILRMAEAKLLYVEETGPQGYNNPQWERILSHVESINENDWRLAILEADIMLNTLLDNMGLPGDTIADKLKMVEKSDFVTIDNALEAHKIRNQIAHEGATFVINQHEVRRVIGLYQTVFEEFRII